MAVELLSKALACDILEILEVLYTKPMHAASKSVMQDSCG